MTVTATYHGHREAISESGMPIEALPAQIGDAQTGADITCAEEGLYRIHTSAACTLRIGASGAGTAATGEPWVADRCEVRFIRKDQHIKSV